MSSSDLYLGGSAENAFRLDSSDLTTHGVIVGMTGSGKTGLGVVMLEELLAADIPCLILDPKGDMGNLLLNFPQFRGEDFAPWVDPAEAAREGMTTEALGEEMAARWRKGLGGAGIDAEQMRRVTPGADIRILTPGSTAGIPVDLVGDLSPPDAAAAGDRELITDEIEGLVSGILVLAGIDADPLTSREHILLANLVEYAWSQGRSLDLPTLIGWVHRPPLRRLGVFELDAFFPEKDRMKLAMRLNGLVASPSFEEWMRGEPLDVGTLLRAPDGRPRASIFYLSHLSDNERMFVVARLLTKLITWMRSQPGTSELRALLYADEVAGFAPPSGEPPTKRALLTLYKQARAHGLGVVLSTQNPVDLDYKIMSNAGTWMVGRLQTENDKRRILEGLRSAAGDVDVSAWDDRIGGLAKREFLIRRAGSAAPETFSTRWAMSYLRGPLTRTEVIGLRGKKEDARATRDAPAAPPPHDHTPESASGPAPATDPVGALPDDATPLRPDVADGVPVGFLDAAAPWAAKLGSDPGAPLEAGIATRVELLFDDRRGDLRHEEVWEALFFPIATPVQAREARIVDYDPRDFRDEEPEGAIYRIPDFDLSSRTAIRDATATLKDFLYANRTVEVLRNAELKLYSRVGESREAFEERCMEAAEDAADVQAEKLRDRFESRLDTARRKLRERERRVRDLEATADARRQEEFLAGASDVLGMFLGGRRRTRSLSTMARRRNRSRSSDRRADDALERLDEAQDTIEAIEADLSNELEALWARWEAAAKSITSFEVGLEKSDIRVTDTRVFFAPGPGS